MALLAIVKFNSGIVLAKIQSNIFKNKDLILLACDIFEIIASAVWPRIIKIYMRHFQQAKNNLKKIVIKVTLSAEF